jgi:hypothetical protein
MIMILSDYMLHYAISRAEIASDLALKVRENLEGIFGSDYIKTMRDEYNEIDVVGRWAWAMTESLKNYSQEINTKSVLKGLRS